VGAQGTVLVVEDDDDLRIVVIETLERDGIAVLAARDGVEALEILTFQPQPCLILLDLMMPRMSGWEFRRRQLADPRLAGVPVVVMTATTTLDEAAIQADDLLRKPLSLPSLLALVRRYARTGQTPPTGLNAREL